MFFDNLIYTKAYKKEFKISTKPEFLTNYLAVYRGSVPALVPVVVVLPVMVQRQ